MTFCPQDGTLQSLKVRRDPLEATRQLTSRRGATRMEGQSHTISKQSIMPKQATGQVLFPIIHLFRLTLLKITQCTAAHSENLSALASSQNKCYWKGQNGLFFKVVRVLKAMWQSVNLKVNPCFLQVAKWSCTEWRVKLQPHSLHPGIVTTISYVWDLYRQSFSTRDTFNLCSATGMQVVSSVQRPITLSSSSSAPSTNPPINHEAREKIHIKQVLSSDDKSLGEYLCNVFDGPTLPLAYSTSSEH